MKKFTGDIIISHMCTKNHMMYGSWDTEWDRQNFLSFWGISWPFFHTPNPSPSITLMILKIKILKKKHRKKRLEILSFHTYICIINEDHMMCGSWNIRRDRQKCLSFWEVFCLFSPLTMQKIKILKFKKHLEILSSYTLAP